MFNRPRIHQRARSDSQARPQLNRRGIQIGPRIRVGGTLGKIGQDIKTGVGKAASIAAPVASFFNPALGAALGAGGRILDTTHGGAGISDIALAGLKNYGIGKAGQALGGAIKGGGLSGILNAGKGVIQATGGFAGGAPGALGAAGGTNGAPGGVGAQDILKILGLAGAGVAGYQGYQAAKEAGAKQDAALARNTGIAGALEQNGQQLLAGAAPIRNAAQAAMTQRLAAGRRATPLLPAPRRVLTGPMVPPPAQV